MDKLLADAAASPCPSCWSHSLWDQEDIYGALAVYKALKPKDTSHDKVFLVIGPWHHGQEIDRRQLARGHQVRQRHRPLLPPRHPRALPRPVSQGRRAQARRRPRHRLRDRNERWRRLPAWPAGCEAAATPKPTPLYLQPGLKLGFTAPAPANGLRRVRLRPRQARALPRASQPADRLTPKLDLGRAGSSTISARPPAAPTSWPS